MADLFSCPSCRSGQFYVEPKGSTPTLICVGCAVRIVAPVAPVPHGARSIRFQILATMHEVDGAMSADDLTAKLPHLSRGHVSRKLGSLIKSGDVYDTGIKQRNARNRWVRTYRKARG